MKRRTFIAGLGAAAAWPVVARAQQTRLPSVGILLVGLSPDSKAAQHFRRGLRDAGYLDGRNLVIEWRTANGDYDRVPGLIDDLIRKNVDVMVMDSTVGAEVAIGAPGFEPGNGGIKNRPVALILLHIFSQLRRQVHYVASKGYAEIPNCRQHEARATRWGVLPK